MLFLLFARMKASGQWPCCTCNSLEINLATPKQKPTSRSMVHAGRSTADIGVVSVEMVRPGQPAYHPAVHVQREGPGELCRAVPYDGEP